MATNYFCAGCGEELPSTALHGLVIETGKRYCFGCEPKGVVVSTFVPDDYEPSDPPGWEGGFADNH